MTTLILPGYSIKNKDWAKECSEKINQEGIIRPVYWDHWKDSNEKFDPEEKGRLLSGVVKDDKVNIIAKSLGTLVATYIIKNIPNQIEKVILNGIPINDLTENDVEVLRIGLKMIDSKKIVCIQNVNDPHGSFDQIKEFLESISSDIVLISKDRSDHEYFYFEDFKEFLTK